MTYQEKKRKNFMYPTCWLNLKKSAAGEFANDRMMPGIKRKETCLFKRCFKQQALVIWKSREISRKRTGRKRWRIRRKENEDVSPGKGQRREAERREAERKKTGKNRAGKNKKKETSPQTDGDPDSCSCSADPADLGRGYDPGRAPGSGPAQAAAAAAKEQEEREQQQAEQQAEEAMGTAMEELQEDLEAAVLDYDGSWSVYVKELEYDNSFSINNRRHISGQSDQTFCNGRYL